MTMQICSRCRQEERIPTHQFVKFDDRVNYLCRSCWDRFREWFHKPIRIPSEPEGEWNG